MGRRSLKVKNISGLEPIIQPAYRAGLLAVTSPSPGGRGEDGEQSRQIGPLQSGFVRALVHRRQAGNHRPRQDRSPPHRREPVGDLVNGFVAGGPFRRRRRPGSTGGV